MIFSTSTDITRVIEQSEMKVVNIDYCEKNEDLIFFSFFFVILKEFSQEGILLLLSTKCSCYAQFS